MRTAMNETQVRLRLYCARAEKSLRRLPPPPRTLHPRAPRRAGAGGVRAAPRCARRPQPDDDLETVGQAAEQDAAAVPRTGDGNAVPIRHSRRPAAMVRRHARLPRTWPVPDRVRRTMRLTSSAAVLLGLGCAGRQVIRSPRSARRRTRSGMSCRPRVSSSRPPSSATTRPGSSCRMPCTPSSTRTKRCSRSPGPTCTPPRPTSPVPASPRQQLDAGRGLEVHLRHARRGRPRAAGEQLQRLHRHSRHGLQGRGRAPPARAEPRARALRPGRAGPGRGQSAGRRSSP